MFQALSPSSVGKGLFFFPGCSSAFEADILGHCPLLLVPKNGNLWDKQSNAFMSSVSAPNCPAVHPSPPNSPGSSRAGQNFDWWEKAQPILAPTRPLRRSWLHRPRRGCCTSVSTSLRRLPWLGAWGGEPWTDGAELQLV